MRGLRGARDSFEIFITTVAVYVGFCYIFVAVIG
jgi:hypothetical protein